MQLFIMLSTMCLKISQLGNQLNLNYIKQSLYVKKIWPWHIDSRVS